MSTPTPAAAGQARPCPRPGPPPRPLPGPPPAGQSGTTPAGPALIGPRHIHVLGLMANGQTDEQIGRALGMSADTVAGHLKNALRALGAADRAHAVALGIVHGYIRLEAVRCANGQRPPVAPPTAPPEQPKAVREDIAALIRAGASDREIARRTGALRRTVARARRKLAAASAEPLRGELPVAAVLAAALPVPADAAYASETVRGGHHLPRERTNP